MLARQEAGTPPRLFRNGLIYAGGDLATRGLAFLLIPLYTHYLDPADYGVIAVLGSVSSMISTVALLGLPGAATRYYFEYEDKARRRQFLRAVWLLVLASAAISGLVLTAVGAPLAETLLPGIAFIPLVLMSIWAASLGTLPSIPLAIARAAERPVQYVGLSILIFFVTTGLMIWFVAVKRMGATGVILAQLVAASIMAIVAFLAMRPHVEGKVRRDDGVRALHFGLPLIPHAIATWVLAVSDRLILQTSVSLSDVGLYSLGYQFGMIMMFVGVAANNAWAPNFIKRALAADSSLGAACTRFVAVAVWLTVGVALFGDEVIRLVLRPAYVGAADVAPIIAIGYGLTMLYYVPVGVLFVAKRTRILALCSALAAGLNIALNLWLIPRWGITAAAVNTVVAFGVQLILVTAAARASAPFTWEARRIGLILGMSVLALVAGLPLDRLGSVARVGGQFGVMAALTVGGVWVVTSRSERLWLLRRLRVR